MSSTISALVYSAWADSGGSWVETIEVMRTLDLYPLGKADKEFTPAPLLTSSGLDEEVPIPVFGQEAENDYAPTPFSEYIEPSALDLSLTEKGDLSNASDSTVTSNLCTGSTQEGSKDQQDVSPILLQTTNPDSSPIPSTRTGLSLGINDMALYWPDEEDPDTFDILGREDEFLNPREDASYLRGTDECRSLNVCDDALEIFSMCSTVLSEGQSDVDRGSSAGEQRIMKISTIVKKNSGASEVPSLKRNNSQRHCRETVSTAEARSGTLKRRATGRIKPLKKSGTGGTATDLYIAHEKLKSLDRNMSCPDEYLLNTEGQSRMADLELGDFSDMLCTVNYILGGCEVLVTLRDALKAYRQRTQIQTAGPPQDMSFKRRLQIIRDLDSNIAYHTLLKNCHTLYFTREAMSRCAITTGVFVTVNPDDLESQVQRRRGNPLNLAEAAITKDIMSEMHPDFQEGSLVYGRLYAEVKGTRRFGQRLDKLVNTFGLGILGLTPLVHNVSTAPQAFEITYEALFKTTDKVFTNMIQMIGECQGDNLRILARAVEPIVKGIYHQTIDETIRFGIDGATREDIVRHPKGAPELIAMVSCLHTLPAEQADTQA